MCLAVPGKIIKIKKGKAVIDYGVEQRTAAFLEQDLAIGDYVIVQGGFVVQKIPEKEAKQALQLYVEAMKEA